MEQPTLAVITVVKNGATLLERTIQSVLSQHHPGLQYIVVDGGSTDGTVDVIRRYQDHISDWLSEEDEGVYYGMNKAIRMVEAPGHIFLNAGDYFAGQVIGPDMPIPSRVPLEYADPLGRLRRARAPSRKTGLPFFHQSIVFQSKGLQYDTRYSIFADYQYYLDHGYRGDLPEYRSTGRVHFESTGMNTRNRHLRDEELVDIVKRHFSSAVAHRLKAYLMLKDAARPVVRATGLWRRAETP